MTEKSPGSWNGWLTPAGAGTPGTGAPDARWRGWAPVLLPGLVTFAVTTWGIGWASFWRDEAATVSATRRSLPALVAMLGHVDAVHGAYYLLMWPIVHMFGPGEVVMRLPSAAAMAGAACGVAACGRRLGCWQTGLWAGLVFAALPMTSRYGQEARSYALVTAAAVLASYLLVRLITTPGRRWLAGYGLSLAVLGLLNIFGLLIVPAHAVTLAVARRRRGAHPNARGWLLAVGAAAVATSPVALYAWRERAQFAWLLTHKPGWPELAALVTGLAGSAVSAGLIAALGLLGMLGGPDRRSIRQPGLPQAGWLSAPWLIVPPAILFAVSAAEPAYQLRYLVFCLPAVALLAGTGLAVLTRYSRIAAGTLLAAAALLALPAAQAIREPAGHGDNIRAAAEVIRAYARPSDTAVYDDPGTRTDSLAYPYGFGELRDISLRQTPAQAGNLGGTEAGPGVLESRLARAQRVWLIEVQSPPGVPAVIAAPGFRLVRSWRIDAMTLWLFTRSAPG